MRGIGTSLGTAAMLWTAAQMVAAPARALELADLAPLLTGIPSEILSYTDQGTDADGRVYLAGIRVNVPDFGIVSADRLSLGDLDLEGIVAGGPDFVDLHIDGLRLSRNTYLAPTPWPFAADVLTGDIALAYAIRDEQPGAIEGTLSIDFGDDGRIAGSISMLEPDWYRDDMGPEDRLPDLSRRVLPRQASLHLSGFAVGGEALAALSEGKWPGLDIALSLDFDFAVSDEDDSLALAAAVTSNLGAFSLAADGVYGRLIHEEFNQGMRSSESFADLIEWTGARLSYEDQGLVDTLLSIAMAAEREPAMLVLAEALENLGESARDLGQDGPARSLLHTLRRVVLNFGTYEGDRISVSVRPVAPVAFSVLDDVRVHPEIGLHPDDLLALLRLRYTYQSR